MKAILSSLCRWLALSEEWRNERRRNLHSFFPKKKTSVPYSSFIISRRLLFKMAASLSYRSGGSVRSTAARSAGRGAAVRAPIAAAARPASSSSTSAAVVAAAALLRRSSNGALPPPLALCFCSRVFLPCSIAAMNALSRTCWVESLAFRGSLRVDIGTAFWQRFRFRARASAAAVRRKRRTCCRDRESPFFHPLFAPASGRLSFSLSPVLPAISLPMKNRTNETRNSETRNQ